MEIKGVSVCFLWVPAHVGVEGNEHVDILAKQAFRIKHVDLQLLLRRTETKTEYSDYNVAGRHLYNIQRHVVAERQVSWKTRGENVITC